MSFLLVPLCSTCGIPEATNTCEGCKGTISDSPSMRAINCKKSRHCEVCSEQSTCIWNTFEVKGGKVIEHNCESTDISLQEE